MPRESARDWIRSVERAEPQEQWIMLCFLAGHQVELDSDERHGTLRRAELLLATGGDPRRALELYGRAVTAVAHDLDSPTARAQLADALAVLKPACEGLRGASEALRLLLSDGDLAWQCFAAGLLADALTETEA